MVGFAIALPTLHLLESNASALDVFWSSTLQLWTFFGVQRFSFGRILEFNALALENFGVQRFSFGRFLESNALDLNFSGSHAPAL
jgi:hypothetical protein